MPPITHNRGFVTEINAFGYEACYASYKGGEQWRQGMLKVRAWVGRTSVNNNSRDCFQ